MHFVQYHIPTLLRKQGTERIVGIRVGSVALYFGAEALHLYYDRIRPAWHWVLGLPEVR